MVRPARDGRNGNPRGRRGKHREPDVAGAGDSVFTAASMALFSGADIWLASYFASIVAALQIARVGNRPINRDEILSEIGQIDHI